MARPQEHSETVVSQGMRIDGELKSNGSIRIDGLVSGKVHTSQDLTVGPNAQIDADLIAGNAIIGGIVKGNVMVKGTLIIMETGKIVGNISCAKLGIAEGAYFSGACKMTEIKPQVETRE